MGAALLARDGRIVLEAAAGPADVERAVPNTPATRFRIASLTKLFTAAAVLRLEERGLLDTRLPAAVSLHEMPAAWRSITVRQLLEHTSGIPNFTDPALKLRSGLSRHGANPRQVLDLVARFALDFEPGSRFAYSNSGYLLLGLLIERVSGMPYGEFLRGEFFEPLRLAGTGYGHPPADPQTARGYRVDGGDLEPAEYTHIDVAFSAGGLYSTARDLLAFTRSVRPAFCFEDSAFGCRRLRHGGSIAGFAAAMQIYPEAGVTAIVLSNLESAQTGGLATALAGTILESPAGTPGPGAAGPGP